MNGDDRGATPQLTARSVRAGAFIGVGVAGFLDETVFHQILHWHHFYDKGSADAGLVSDGLFSAAGWTCVVVGLFLFADLQRRRGTVPKRVWAGGLLGWGGFQLYDGLIQHKLLGLHQIRYHVDLLPYDLIWNTAGALAVLAGAYLLHQPASPAAERRQPATGP